MVVRLAVMFHAIVTTMQGVALSDLVLSKRSYRFAAGRAFCGAGLVV